MSDQNNLGEFVTSTRDFVGKNKRPHEDGIFSEKIFGPIKSYCCNCGKLKGPINAGKVCQTCGVLCDTNELRYTTFGKIKTYYPFIKPTNKNKLTKLLGEKELKGLLDPKRADMNEELKRYIAIRYDFSEFKIVSNLKTTNSKFLVIPLRITGIYSLYNCLCYIDRIFDIQAVKDVITSDVFTNILYVLPPNLRSVSFDKVQDQLHSPELNKQYISLLNSNNFISKTLDEEYDKNHVEEVFNMLKTQLQNKILDQEILDQEFIKIDKNSYIYQQIVNNIYEIAQNELSCKDGLIRNSILSKNIEFSARTVVRTEPSIEPYQIKVSRSILEKLWTPYFMFYLIKKNKIEPYECLQYLLSQDNCYEKESDKDYYYDKFFDSFLTWITTDEDDELLTAKEKVRARLTYFNRQPTLWRHGIPCKEIVPNDVDDKTIGVNPLALEPLNMDFDGDTAAIYLVHDAEALDEMYDKAFYRNTIRLDADNEILSVIRHETLYAAFTITYFVEPKTDNVIETVNNLYELTESIELMNNNIYDPVQVDGKIYTYGICLLNKWAGFEKVLLNKQIDKKETKLLSEKIYEYFGHDYYYEVLNYLQKQLLFFISITNHNPTVDPNEMISFLNPENEELFMKLPENNIMLGYTLNESILDRCIDNMDQESEFYKLFKSGSRFNRQQLARSCANIGYIADSKNIINPVPIKSNLMKGLTKENFFKGSPGTKKGIADKAYFTPASGYLERTLVMGLSPIIISEDDCGTSHYIESQVFSKKHAISLIGKYIKEESKPEQDWYLVTNDNYSSIINRKIHIRSPITCTTSKYKICRKCFGERYFPTEYIGVLAGQIIAERLTQLIMRSFHTSGSASLDISNEVKDYFKNTLTDIKNTDSKIYIYVNGNIDDAPQLITNIEGFNSVDRENNSFIFDCIHETKKNSDAVETMNNVSNLLKKDNSCKKKPSDFYTEMMTYLLGVGNPFSSFCEMIFANMFQDENEKIWRYTNMDKKPKIKLSDKMLAASLDKKLGCLYKPNKQTLPEINNIDVISDDPTIYEKIWFCRF